MCRASSPPSPSATAWYRAGRVRARSGATPGRAPWRRAARARAVSLLPRHGRRHGPLGGERQLLVAAARVAPGPAQHVLVHRLDPRGGILERERRVGLVVQLDVITRREPREDA